MDELIPDKAGSMPVEISQDAMPVPEEGKCLYITLGSRIIVPRDKFMAWIDEQSAKKTEIF